MRRTAGSAPPRRSRQRTGNHSTPPVESHDDGHARKAKTQSRQFSPKPETGVGPTSPEPVYPRGYQANTSSSSCLQTQSPACQHSDCHRSIATSPKRVSSNPQPSFHTTSCAISSAEEHSQYRLTSHDYGQRAMREVTRPGVSSKVKLSPTSPTSNHYLPRVTSSTEQQSQYSQPHRDIRRGIAELDLGSRPSPSTHLIRRRVVLPGRVFQCHPSIADYRCGYPMLKDDSRKNANYEFYTGKIPFHPKGVYIDVILTNWWGRYDILEARHDYIQWLFPTQDGSRFNYYAQPLQRHEIKALCADHRASGRVVKAYKMMLDFYGMRLDPLTGEVEQKEQDYIQRFAVLNTSIHNQQRITRILKCLGELEYEHLKPPLLRFILKEAILHGDLGNAMDSCMHYWVETIRDSNERDSLWLLAQDLTERRNSIL